MEKQKTIAVVAFLLIIVIACVLIATAGNYHFPWEKPGVNNGNASPVIIEVHQNGTVTRLVNGSRPVSKAIPISELKKIKVPDYILNAPSNTTRPADYGLSFLKKYMTDLSEEEQDQLIGDALKVINGTSPMSKENQTKIMMKIGTYLISAENGGNITEHANGSAVLSPQSP